MPKRKDEDKGQSKPPREGKPAKRPLTKAEQHQQIGELRGRVDTSLAGGTSLVVGQHIIGSATSAELVKSTLGGADFTVQNTQAAATNESLSVTGNADMLGIASLPVKVDFTPTAAGTRTTIVGTAPAGGPISLTGIAVKLFGGKFSVPQRLATLQFGTFTLTVDPAGDSVTFVGTVLNTVDIAGGLIVLSEATLILVGSNLTQDPPTIDATINGKLNLVLRQTVKLG